MAGLTENLDPAEFDKQLAVGAAAHLHGSAAPGPPAGLQAQLWPLPVNRPLSAQVNLRGATLCIKHAARAMKATAPSRGGCIITTSSIAGLLPNCGVPGAPPFYCAAGARSSACSACSAARRVHVPAMGPCLAPAPSHPAVRLLPPHGHPAMHTLCNYPQATPRPRRA